MSQSTLGAPAFTTSAGAGWTLNPARALPADPGTRAHALHIYEATRSLPIVAGHGHVDAALLADNTPFPSPAALLVEPDHYLVRMLGSVQPGPFGVPGVSSQSDLRSGSAGTASDREIWRRFCQGWHLFRGTPTRYWMEHVLSEVFGAPVPPSADTADLLYDHIAERLADDAYRPRALFDSFGIELLASTDPADSTLSDHARLRASDWSGTVVPTFRPDEVTRIDGAGWSHAITRLSAAADRSIGGYADYIQALVERRAAFVAAGARASDHGTATADTTPLSDADARRIFDRALAGDLHPGDADAFEAHMLYTSAEMAADDGLVMQLHPGVQRSYDHGQAARFGTDIGYDIPVAMEYTRALRPLLNNVGHHPGFRMIVFTIDETVFSRELAPLAGVYPSLRLGAPWWFLDSADGMRRYREAVTDTAGFYNTAGFVDDTRAFCSIPARHDLARRIDAGYLARLVAEHRLDLSDATQTAIDLAYRLPVDSYSIQPRTGGTP
ncbi:MAG: glucuronate isomerase [Mycetocola sp.]